MTVGLRVSRRREVIVVVAAMRSSRCVLAWIEFGARNTVLDEVLRVQVRRRVRRRREGEQCARVASRVIWIRGVALQVFAKRLNTVQFGSGHHRVDKVVVEFRPPLGPYVKIATDRRLEVVLEEIRTVTAHGGRQRGQLARRSAHLH